MASEIKVNCFDCGKTLTFVASISFREECEHCSADVHVCKNCRFYDPSAYNECREPSAEVVREKDRANFCDYFQTGDAEGGNKKRDDLLSAAEALFKKK